MSKLLERGVGLLNDADATVKQLGPKLDNALDGITKTVDNADDLVVGLKQGRGPAGMLLQEQGLATQIRQVVANCMKHCRPRSCLQSGGRAHFRFPGSSSAGKG